MLEFKTIQELKSNAEILEIIKDYTYETKNGKVKHLTNTNLQFIFHNLCVILALLLFHLHFL